MKIDPAVKQCADGLHGGAPPVSYTHLDVYKRQDSKCPNSSMVPKVKEQIGNDSLLNKGTWAFLGSSTNKSNRYFCLLYTSPSTPHTLSITPLSVTTLTLTARAMPTTLRT